MLTQLRATTPGADDGIGQGLGCMSLGEDPDDGSDQRALRVIGAALDAGVAMLDTADMYGNEAPNLLHKNTSSRRPLMPRPTRVIWGEDGDWSLRSDRAYVYEACEASLRRLGVDTIDLYYLHIRNEATPIEETVLAMAELAEQGKIRALGLSNITEEDLRRALIRHGFRAASLCVKDCRHAKAVSEAAT